MQFNEPTEALYDALTSEDQWNHIMPQSAKGGKKAALMATAANGQPKRGFPNGERTAQLPRKGGDDVPFSQEQEAELIHQLLAKMKEVDKAFEEEIKAKEGTEAKLKALREELGQEAAQQAAQQASGDRSRRR